MDLSPREIASLIWVTVLLAWLAFKPDVRNSILDLIRCLMHPKILAWLLSIALYGIGITFVMASANLWISSDLKDTIMWFLFSSIVMCCEAMDRGEVSLGKTIRECVRVSIVVEYLISAHTFSLRAELILVPIMTVVVMLDVVAQTRDEHKAVHKLLYGLQVFAGVVLVTNATLRTISDFQSLNGARHVRALTINLIYSVLFVPFVYLMLLYSNYEHLFMRIDLYVKEPLVRRYAKWRILQYCGCSLQKLRSFVRTKTIEITRVFTREDVNRLVAGTRIPHSEF